MAEANVTRACVVCGSEFARDGKRLLCSDACKRERQLQYHRAEPRKTNCRKCGIEFIGRASKVYCGNKCKDAARPERIEQAARASERLKSRTYDPSDRSHEYAEARNKRAQARNMAMLFVDCSRVDVELNKQALLICANISRKNVWREWNVRRLVALADRVLDRLPGSTRGRAASTIALKSRPKAYAKALTQWRKKSLKRKTGITMLDDGTVTDAVMLGGSHCLYCNCKLNDMNRTHDHMRPLSRGGVHSASNIAPCCRDCNTRKGAKDFEHWVLSLAPPDSRRAVAYYEKRNGAMRQLGLALAA